MSAHKVFMKKTVTSNIPINKLKKILSEGCLKSIGKKMFFNFKNKIIF